jgi:hypothetical protein
VSGPERGERALYGRLNALPGESRAVNTAHGLGSMNSNFPKRNGEVPLHTSEVNKKEIEPERLNIVYSSRGEGHKRVSSKIDDWIDARSIELGSM